MIQDLGSNSVSPDVVVQTIYRAATDVTDQLRYPATPDAIALLEKRSKENDEIFIGEFRKQFGL